MTLRPSPRELCRAWTSDEQEFAKGYIRARSLIRESGCWEWTRYIDYAGYGKGAIFSSTPLGAHRIAFAAWGGVLDSALTLDHLCRNRKCVNPAHLEQISHRENTLRGENVGAINFRKTTCKKGHPLIMGVDIKSEKDKCPIDGAEIFQRLDDTPAGIKKRLQVNQEETMPVVENFRERGLLVEIDGTPSIDEVFENILEKLDERNID